MRAAEFCIRVALGVAAASGLAVTGCSRRPVAANPAAICAARDSAERLKQALFQRAASDQFGHNRSAMPKLVQQSRLRLKYPLLDAYDRDTQRATCSATVVVRLPGGVLNPGATEPSSQVHYTLQPMADGSGLHFDMTGGDEVVSGIAEADASRWAAANGLAPTVAVAQAAPGLEVVGAGRPAAPAPVLAGAPTPGPPKPPAPPRLVAVAAQPAAPPRLVTVAAQPIRHTASRPAPSSPVRVARLDQGRREDRFADSSPPPAPPPGGLDQVSAGAGSRTRVFIHIADPDQRGEAEALRERLGEVELDGGSVDAPPVRLVSATPGRAEVRCLKAADCAAARRVASELGRMLPGGAPPVVDLHQTYERDARIRRGTLELWLPRDEGPEDP